MSDKMKQRISVQMEIITAGLVSTAFMLLGTISRLMVS